MNKKRLLLVFLSILFSIGLSFTIWFISNINFYGKLYLSYKSSDKVPDSSVLLKAHTPTGREIIIPFINGYAEITGFNKEMSIHYPCDVAINEISIKHNKIKRTYQPADNCISGNKSIVLSNEVIQNKSFVIKLYKFLAWLFFTPLVQDLLLGLFLLCLLLLSYLNLRRIRIKIKVKKINEKHFLLKLTTVFFSGLLFWGIITLIVIEISLRIFGSYFSSKQTETEKNTASSSFTVLCVGDSFTYGIGAHRNKSYPAQLEDIIEANQNINVQVINKGICAGNTTQMLQELQPSLNKYKPDVVVMLFGMANSWNYYGFSANDNFWYRIRTYKLLVRFIQSIKYKNYGLEMFQKTGVFSDQLKAKIVRSVMEHDDVFEIYYLAGRFYLSKFKWREAINAFCHASTFRPQNDSTRHALSVCIEKMDCDFFYNHYQEKLIQNTVVSKTINTLDSLIDNYPQSIDLPIVKYRYLIEKGDTAAAKEMITMLQQKYPERVIFYFDIEKLMSESEIQEYYESNFQNKDQSTGLQIAMGYYFLKKNKPDEAEKCFNGALLKRPQKNLAKFGKYILELRKIKNYKEFFLSNRNDFWINSILLVYSQVYHIKPNNKLISMALHTHPFIKDIIKTSPRQNSDSTKTDSLYYKYSAEVVNKYFEKSEKDHDKFFLIHVKKRTMTLKEQEVFNWIETDINAMIDICSKQGFPVICMNYPLIPPPRSQEISFWATRVGEIWKKTAKNKNMLFIDQDSLFTINGADKSELFEPRYTGTEHCNEKGYNLMARNVYQCMEKNGLFPKK